MTLLFPDLPTVAPAKWRARKGPTGRNASWTHPALPGVEVCHCGHPTALRPYYVIGRPFKRKYRLLAVAQRAAETGIEWPEGAPT